MHEALKSDTPTAVAIHTRSTNGASAPAFNAAAPTTAARQVTAPSDMSKPPIEKMKLEHVATIASVANWLMSSLRFTS